MYIASSYYYRSERTYAFGPFTEEELKAFLENEPDAMAERHEDWSIRYVNNPSLFGSGQEISEFPD